MLYQTVQLLSPTILVRVDVRRFEFTPAWEFFLDASHSIYKALINHSDSGHFSLRVHCTASS